MIRPRKRLGQHFLHDPNTARKIVASLDAPTGAVVVEIGPGTGALTGLLRDRFEHLVTIEVDERAVHHLRKTYPLLDVRQEDVLQFDWSRLSEENAREIHVVGNLPYNITTPILFSILEAGVIKSALLMMQKEVADRLVASPRTKAYGAPSVLVQLFASPEMLFKVSPYVFSPRPAVESAVIRIDFEEAVVTSPALKDAVRRTVRTAFSQRRKTLRNSLRPLLANADRQPPVSWLSKRAEELNPEQFVELTRLIFGTV